MRPPPAGCNGPSTTTRNRLGAVSTTPTSRDSRVSCAARSACSRRRSPRSPSAWPGQEPDPRAEGCRRRKQRDRDATAGRASLGTFHQRHAPPWSEARARRPPPSQQQFLMIITVATPVDRVRSTLATPVAWGVVFGVLQAASPLALFWLDPRTVYALGLPLIAAVYIGFAVADGRPHVLAVETAVASAFVVVAAAAVTGSAWLIVAGLAGHGLKDMWQHRTGFVAGTRWWPPFCAAVDFVAAGLIAVAITAALPLLS